jgi:Bacterial Ig-like domain (group 2)
MKPSNAQRTLAGLAMCIALVMACNPDSRPLGPGVSAVDSLIIDGVWDWTERIVDSVVTCNDTGSYSFTQVGLRFDGMSRQVGSCQTPGDNAHADLAYGGIISGNDIHFAVGGYCNYTGHAGSPATTLTGTVTCSNGVTTLEGTWSAVRQEPVGSVTIVAPAITMVPGVTAPLLAQLADAQGNRVFFRSITWTSDQPGVATVYATRYDSALVTGVAPGSATVTASAGGKSGGVSIPVLPRVASIVVTPALDTIGPGMSVQLVATPLDAGGSPITGWTIAWSSENATAASVSPTGVVTGVGAGATNVHAAVGGVIGTAQISVTGTPISIAGEWDFENLATSCDPFSGCVPAPGCRQPGSMVLTQNGFVFSGTEALVAGCAGMPTSGPITGGVVSGREVSFTFGGCQFVTIATANLDSLSGPASCSDYVDGNVFFQAVRVGPPTSVGLTPASTVAHSRANHLLRSPR